TGGLYVGGAYTDAITFAPLAPLMGDASFLAKSDDLTTVVPTTQAQLAWSVAPVPADLQFTITQRAGAAIGDLRVMDAMGREVQRAGVRASSLTIDCSAWPAGSYIVQCGQERQQVLVVR
ncbi:MAG TPA: T9SS type A sorting domain-containing protein, partial [Flavobacteriales bacterium]|nr:T9SS type A sorting domain-containing protein [Flavobacteriales bacterium]